MKNWDNQIITEVNSVEVMMLGWRYERNKNWRISVKKGLLTIKIVKQRHHGTPLEFCATSHMMLFYIIQEVHNTKRS